LKKKLDLPLIFKTIGSLVILKQIHEKETNDLEGLVNQTRLQEEKGSSRKAPPPALQLRYYKKIACYNKE